MPLSTETVEQDPVDTIIISATVYLRTAEFLPEQAKKIARRITTRADSSLAVSLGFVDIATNDNAKRQEEIALALTGLWRKFNEAGFADLPLDDNHELVLSISLCPEWGQASIAIGAESLQPWISVRARLHVDDFRSDPEDSADA